MYSTTLTACTENCIARCHRNNAFMGAWWPHQKCPNDRWFANLCSASGSLSKIANRHTHTKPTYLCSNIYGEEVWLETVSFWLKASKASSTPPLPSFLHLLLLADPLPRPLPLSLSLNTRWLQSASYTAFCNSGWLTFFLTAGISKDIINNQCKNEKLFLFQHYHVAALAWIFCMRQMRSGIRKHTGLDKHT